MAAEKPEKETKKETKSQGQAQPPVAPAKRKPFLNATVIAVVVVSVVEAGVFYAAMKLFGGGPQVAYGEQEHVMEGQPPAAEKATLEITVVDKFRAPNRTSGRAYIFEMDVIVKVPASRKERIESLVAQHKAEIADHLARIVRAADVSVLYEPELKTLRMQVRRAMSEMAEDPDIVLEVLIPRCVPYLSD